LKYFRSIKAFVFVSQVSSPQDYTTNIEKMVTNLSENWPKSAVVQVAKLTIKCVHPLDIREREMLGINPDTLNTVLTDIANNNFDLS
jgi:hypothetical protein